jgi:hypothetical protein
VIVFAARRARKHPGLLPGPLGSFCPAVQRLSEVVDRARPRIRSGRPQLAIEACWRARRLGREPIPRLRSSCRFCFGRQAVAEPDTGCPSSTAPFSPGCRSRRWRSRLRRRRRSAEGDATALSERIETSAFGVAAALPPKESPARERSSPRPIGMDDDEQRRWPIEGRARRARLAAVGGGDGCDRADANEHGDACGPQPENGRENRPHRQARVV